MEFGMEDALSGKRSHAFLELCLFVLALRAPRSMAKPMEPSLYTSGKGGAVAPKLNHCTHTYLRMSKLSKVLDTFDKDGPIRLVNFSLSRTETSHY